MLSKYISITFWRVIVTFRDVLQLGCKEQKNISFSYNKSYTFSHSFQNILLNQQDTVKSVDGYCILDSAHKYGQKNLAKISKLSLPYLSMQQWASSIVMQPHTFDLRCCRLALLCVKTNRARQLNNVYVRSSTRCADDDFLRRPKLQDKIASLGFVCFFARYSLPKVKKSNKSYYTLQLQLCKYMMIFKEKMGK